MSVGREEVLEELHAGNEVLWVCVAPKGPQQVAVGEAKRAHGNLFPTISPGRGDSMDREA